MDYLWRYFCFRNSVGLIISIVLNKECDTTVDENTKKSIEKDTKDQEDKSFKNNLNSWLTEESSSNTQEKLEETLKDLATDFYENYYEAVAFNDDERKLYVQQYEYIGIKINLTGLERYFGSSSSEYLSDFKDVDCDFSTTKAIIYPKSPYDKTDYSIDVSLDCDID